MPPEKLARCVGLHVAALRNIENGRKPAGRETLKDLARVLGVPVAAITRDGTDKGLTDDAPGFAFDADIDEPDLDGVDEPDLAAAS